MCVHFKRCRCDDPAKNSESSSPLAADEEPSSAAFMFLYFRVNRYCNMMEQVTNLV